MSNHELFEIAGTDIAQLGDQYLRELIGLLCEADWRAAGLSTLGIRWSGSQDAKDGGVDVVVRGETAPPPNSFVPRSNALFQVKKSKMKPSDISKEMRPKPELRPSIKEMIGLGGAYVIVSAADSVTEKMLAERLKAMRAAVADDDTECRLLMDFFDQGRIATWVRCHPSMIAWVHQKTGRRFPGWHPWRNWAQAPKDEEYLLDDQLRLLDLSAPATARGLSVKEGMQRLRSILSKPKAVVRLVGLAGVGKTRLAQVLFDAESEQPLHRFLPVYADVASPPKPEPLDMARQLVARKEKTAVVLIVDNCSPPMHRELKKICSPADGDSPVSLLTIDCDVRDDAPEETKVFRLEPASEELVATLIERRFSLGDVERERIAHFSGGNARLAIALAQTVKPDETLSGLHDADLFERLFQQKAEENKSLLRSAEVCSLVYSFQGDGATSEHSELRRLANLVGISAEEVYRDLAELQRRQLVQSRGPWRAVLPQALANYLARRALESIPIENCQQLLQDPDQERLAISFSRRLSYLHDSKKAVEIVEEWLKSVNANYLLDEFKIKVLANVAPVAPESVLTVLEEHAEQSVQDALKEPIVHLLCQLAYDPELFDQSVALLRRHALLELQKDSPFKPAANRLFSLFQVRLSGTHASAETRAKIIEDLTASESPAEQELGLRLLEAALKIDMFESEGNFEFGARKRDFGLAPKEEAATDWFLLFADLFCRLALSEQPIAEQVRSRTQLAESLMRLADAKWCEPLLFEIMKKHVQAIHKQRAWNEGWVATQRIIVNTSQYEESGSLHALAAILHPVSLLEKARAALLLSSSYDAEHLRGIGAEVAKQPDVLHLLLPELVSSSKSMGQQQCLGQGLAKGCKKPEELLQLLHLQLQKTLPEKISIAVFAGFLSSCRERDPELRHSWLDKMVEDPLLGKWIPNLQADSTLDRQDFERLLKAFAFGTASIQCNQIVWELYLKKVDEDDLVRLLREILQKTGGVDVALKTLTIRFGNCDKKHDDGLLAVARKTIEVFFDESPLEFHASFWENYFQPIARKALQGDEGAATTKVVCRKMEAALEKQPITPGIKKFVQFLARTHPLILLDEFFPLEAKLDFLCHIEDKKILSWCAKNPDVRYPAVIEAFFSHIRWPSWTLVFEVLKQTQNMKAVLEQLAKDIPQSRPFRFSSSSKLEEQVRPLQMFCNHENASIRDWAKKSCRFLKKEVQAKDQLEQIEGFEQQTETQYMMTDIQECPP